MQWSLMSLSSQVPRRSITASVTQQTKHRVKRTTSASLLPAPQSPPQPSQGPVLTRVSFLLPLHSLPSTSAGSSGDSRTLFSNFPLKQATLTSSHPLACSPFLSSPSEHNERDTFPLSVSLPLRSIPIRLLPAQVALAKAGGPLNDEKQFPQTSAWHETLSRT